ncbi:MAG TPA: transposase [Tepidisphaeraceae bacterium]|jgi:putative transposase
MPQYRRAFQPGGTFFLTIVTENRAPILLKEPARQFLHTAIDITRRERPFEIDAIVLLPDHWHLMLTLPPGDADYPTRIAAIKARFTRDYLPAGGAEQRRSASRVRCRRRGVWQRHFWEHQVRDIDDHHAHVHDIHYNPVKHGYVPGPHAWAYSSFARAVARNQYEPDWQCRCRNRHPIPPNFDHLPIHHME